MAIKQRTWLLFIFFVCVLLLFTTTALGTYRWRHRVINKIKDLRNIPQLTRMELDERFIRRLYTNENGDTLTYYLYRPREYDPNKQYPLVVILHGVGERLDPEKTPRANQKRVLGSNYIEVWGPGVDEDPAFSIQDQYPSFVLVPHLTNTQRWVNNDPGEGMFTQDANPTLGLQMVKETVDYLRLTYDDAIDDSRLYVTGISMGGFGTWDMIQRWPNYFAAAAPLASAGDPNNAHKIADLPLWIAHGTADDVVPIESIRSMVGTLQSLGADPHYVEYPDVGHTIWDMVFSLKTSDSADEFFAWLYSQRNPTPPSVNSP